MDQIADLLNRIKNGGNAGSKTVLAPHSKFKEAILELLQKEGFVKSYSKKGKKVTRFIEIELSFDGENPRVKGVERVSRPSKRIYVKAGETRSVRQGYGMLVLSTPKGVITDKQARIQKVGGEALFKIW
jgi:small subunit ribosomal protein S8